MFEGIIFFLLTLGISALIDLIINKAILLMEWLIDRIRNFLNQRVGNKVFLCEVEEIVRGLREEAERSGNVAEINQIIAQLDGNGVVEGDITLNDQIDVQIIKADEVDPKITAMLRQYDRQMIIG